MNEKKKIAFFGIKYFPSLGGTSRVAENLILNLANEHDITIYCYKNKLAKSYIKGVEVIEFPKLKLGSLGVFLFYFFCYCHILFKGDYDVIHAHKIDSFFFLRQLSNKAKVVATVHGVPYKDDKWGWLAQYFFKANEKRFLSFKGVKTAISKPLCNYYKENYNVDVKFIPNGINIHQNTSSAHSQSFWPAELPTNSSYVLFGARRIMGIKGLHTMLKAYKKLDYKGNILIAGEMDGYPAYIKQIKELCKGLNVHLLGYVSPLSNLLDLVSKSKYFVFPSEREGMSIMLLEVASVGTPIIASDIPENKQVFDNDEVLYFENKNVSDLSEKILWAEKHKTELEAIGIRAKNIVASRFTWDKISLEYKAIYQSNGEKSDQRI